MLLGILGQNRRDSGDVHSNGVEGFWGFMKRRMGCIGGMRRDRLGLFAAELAWQYNHRRSTDGQ